MLAETICLILGRFDERKYISSYAAMRYGLILSLTLSHHDDGTTRRGTFIPSPSPNIYHCFSADSSLFPLTPPCYQSVMTFSRSPVLSRLLAAALTVSSLTVSSALSSGHTPSAHLSKRGPVLYTASSARMAQLMLGTRRPWCVVHNVKSHRFPAVQQAPWICVLPGSLLYMISARAIRKEWVTTARPKKSCLPTQQSGHFMGNSYMSEDLVTSVAGAKNLQILKTWLLQGPHLHP